MATRTESTMLTSNATERETRRRTSESIAPSPVRPQTIARARRSTQNEKRRMRSNPIARAVRRASPHARVQTAPSPTPLNLREQLQKGSPEARFRKADAGSGRVRGKSRGKNAGA